VDKGKSFDLPEKLLTKNAKGNMIKASAAAYTNIRWNLNNPVPSMATGTVSFKARLE